jgi:uncharacterized protein YndB with AHSA1/START domain
MTEQAAHLAIRHAMTVAVEVRRAFELFTAEMSTWWPARTGHHLSDLPATAMLETREGGRLYERDEQGRELDWGRVREWEPPDRVVLAWHLTPEWRFDPDPAMATEVEVTFQESGDARTRVSFEHRGFEVHGAAGRALSESLGADDGWREVLGEFERAAAAMT